MTTVYDLRHDPSNELVSSANENLRAHDPDVIDGLGEIGSEKWWANFDAREIKSKEFIRKIVAIETDEDDDQGVAVKIQAEYETIEYDYVGIWHHPSVVVGALVKIVSVNSSVQTKYGCETTIIDVKIEVSNG